MNELERPQARISKMAGCEVAFSEVRAGSARQILPQETWSRIGAPNLVIPSRVSEQMRSRSSSCSATEWRVLYPLVACCMTTVLARVRLQGGAGRKPDEFKLGCPSIEWSATLERGR